MNKNFLLASLVVLSFTAPAQAASLPKTASAQSFINNHETRVRLQNLLGTAAYNKVRGSFEVVSVLQNDDDITAFSGCKAHNCAATQSLVVYDRMNDKVKVWYHNYEKVLQVQEDGDFDEDNFGVDLQDAIQTIDAQQ